MSKTLMTCTIPGWNEHVKELHAAARDAYLLPGMETFWQTQTGCSLRANEKLEISI